MIPKHVYEQTLMGFLAPVQPLLADPSVTEVMINGPDTIFVERRGRIERTDARFPSREALTAALRNVAQFVGRQIDDEHPILEARLPDGSRVQAVMPPAAPDGPCVSIRRFFHETLTLGRLVSLHAISQGAARLLETLVVLEQNIVVGGGTGSGKTSLLNALGGLIPREERVVVIEDAREVQLPGAHVVNLEARPGDARGRGAVGVRELFRASLRMRPDRIVVGEVRGGEALDLVQAMTSGHGGCLATVHATYPRDTMARLETLALMSDVDMPLAALRVQLASAVNIIVQTARFADGSRKITHVTEVRGYGEEGYQLVDLYARRTLGRASGDGALRSVFEPTGALPACASLAQAHGLEIPAEMLAAARARRRDEDEG